VLLSTGNEQALAELAGKNGCVCGNDTSQNAGLLKKIPEYLEILKTLPHTETTNLSPSMY